MFDRSTRHLKQVLSQNFWGGNREIYWKSRTYKLTSVKFTFPACTNILFGFVYFHLLAFYTYPWMANHIINGNIIHLTTLVCSVEHCPRQHYMRLLLEIGRWNQNHIQIIFNGNRKSVQCWRLLNTFCRTNLKQLHI